MDSAQTDTGAVLETRLVHKVHRRATALLVDAARLPSTPASALAELRDFIVDHLSLHHEREDDSLWPLISSLAPEVRADLVALSEEHERLALVLEALDGLDIARGGDRTVLIEMAVALRDAIRDHLDREEAVLFPALRAHVSEDMWRELVRKVRAAGPPPNGMHLMIGFFDQVGTAEELHHMLSSFPPHRQPLIPALREQAKAAFAGLESSVSLDRMSDVETGDATGR
ncbi:hemerythrin domain-containing protein [Pendulispora brunnea]|uniref:Hemerythrin domain-containing protein n=1 Tax=Pendulispora brunnea TaxID=2905690 RepID=A0ABZ2KDF8_9BACT